MKYSFMWAEENYNMYDLESILINYSRNSKEKWGQGINDAIAFGKDFYAEFYISEKDIELEAENWHNFFLKNKNVSLFLRSVKKDRAQVFDQIKDVIATNLKKLNNFELIKRYWAYGRNALANLFVAYIVTQPHRIAKIEKVVTNFLKSKGVIDVADCFSKITSPEKILKFAPEGNKFFNASFFELLGKENSTIDKTLINKKMYSEKKRQNYEKNKLLLTLKPPKKIMHWIDLLSLLGHERFKMRFTAMLSLYYNELFFIEFRRRCGVSKAELRAYDEPDLEALLLGNKKLTKYQLARRKEGFLKMLHNGKISTFEGKEALSHMVRISPQMSGVKSLNGMVASKGHVFGKVVVFSYRKSQNHAEKIDKMKPGEVVITEMTRPNIISACEKAAAIVTDEGGILSHASIVSRELGVPCVIGTKHATSVFRDGDYIEVDANKGLVRKISPKEYNDKKHDFILKKSEGVSKKQVAAMHKLKLGDIFWFKDLDKMDLPTVGGKGANLGELFKVANVPDGFCISVNAYKRFLEENGLLAKIKKLTNKISDKNSSELEKVANEIRSLILSKPLSKSLVAEIVKNYKRLSSRKVAIRSSATAEDLPTASFAGQQDTYLNVSSDKEMISCVKKCWASLFTSRAMYYREKNNFKHDQVLISVVVQTMVDAKYAGVMFTIDPVEKKYLLIEIVKGLGEKLVSGEITPNAYHLDRNSLKIVLQKEQFSFDKKSISEIGRLGQFIEKHYKSPQDVEWAIDKKNRIYILQSRAITTL